MDFADEFYVRLYVRDTKTWLRLGFEGQCVLMFLIRKLDRAGVLDGIEDDPESDVALVTKVPLEIVRIGLPRLLQSGVFELRGDRLVMLNYIEAQTAVRTEKARQRASREQRRATARLGVTKRDKQSRNVTESHARSRAVTDCHSVLCCADLICTEHSCAALADPDPERARESTYRARASEPEPISSVAPEPQPEPPPPVEPIPSPTEPEPETIPSEAPEPPTPLQSSPRGAREPILSVILPEVPKGETKRWVNYPASWHDPDGERGPRQVPVSVLSPEAENYLAQRAAAKAAGPPKAVPELRLMPLADTFPSTWLHYPPGWHWTAETEADASVAGVSAKQLQEHVDYWTMHVFARPVRDLDGDLRRSIPNIKIRAETMRFKATALSRADPRLQPTKGRPAAEVLKNFQ